MTRKKSLLIKSRCNSPPQHFYSQLIKFTDRKAEYSVCGQWSGTMVSGSGPTTFHPHRWMEAALPPNTWLPHHQTKERAHVDVASIFLLQVSFHALARYLLQYSLCLILTPRWNSSSESPEKTPLPGGVGVGLERCASQRVFGNSCQAFRFLSFWASLVHPVSYVSGLALRLEFSHKPYLSLEP